MLSATNDQLVLRYYDDLLQRPADATGLPFWSGMLDRGAGKSQVALGLLDSHENHLIEVEQLYLTLLGRAPDPQGFANFVALRDGGVRFDQVETIFMASPEYVQRAGGTSEGFLVSLYQDVLGRAVDPSGEASFSRLLQAGVSREAVAAAVLTSPESYEHQVQQFYVRYLDRAAVDPLAQDWVILFGQGETREQVLAGIVGSPEYFTHFVANPAPVQADRDAVTVPGQAGQTIATMFTITGVRTAFSNEFGFFPVDDVTGRIGNLEPRDDGYEEAALAQPGAHVVFPQGYTSGATATFDLAAGSFFGFYLVQNGSTAQFKKENPGNLLGPRPFVFFDFLGANPDRFGHIHQTGTNQFSFEDQFAGGDLNFSDLQFRIDFAPTNPTDNTPPTITLTSPSAGIVTNHNVTVAGQVTDDSSGVASLQAKIDQGSFSNVTFDANGNFSFMTGLALDGSADGLHTVQMVATDKAGNVSAPVSTTFTLDTIPPAVQVQLDPAFNTGNNHTLAAVVTLDGTTEPNTRVVLEPVGTRTTSDSTGVFTFPGVMLGFGDNDFTAQATDQAGNVGKSQITITRDIMPGGTTLTEGTQFATTFQQTFTVPSQPSALEFEYDNLDFDTTNSIKDAFEASLTDANGNSLVLPISSSQDAFVNISEQQAPLLSPNADLHNTTVDVDLSHITPRTQATLTVRLVNSGSDTGTGPGTSVHISAPQIISASMSTPDAVTPTAPPARPAAVDFSTLSDVTGSMTAVYGETSLNQKTSLLQAGLAITNSGSYGVHGPLVAVINNLSDPSIRVRDADGQTPDGSPYFVLSGSDLSAAQTTGSRTLSFFDPNGIQFTYQLQILGQLNRPPVFTSQPNTEALAGLPYAYQATATDPDHDKLTYSLAISPAGMTVDPNTGKVTWSPQTSDVGNETVLLEVNDGNGGTAQQQYTVSTVMPPPDEPPLFTSTPVIDGNVDTAYAYQATATSPEDDPLTFSLTSAPTGMSVNPTSGLVSWTPVMSQLGTANVTLNVSDGLGGTATQSYAITVQQDPKDQPPSITSDPVTQYNVPPASNPPSGAVNPGSINLTLGNGQTSGQTVSASGLSGGAITIGSLVTGNFGTPGQQDVYTFTLTSNAFLYFDSLTNNPYFAWSLSGPAGSVVSNQQFIASDGNSRPDPVLALPAGAYTLTVLETDANTLNSQLIPLGSVVGNYSFRLSNLAMAAPITPGTPFSGTLNPGNSTNFYQFTATAGQTFYFASLLDQGGTDFRDGWRLIDPFGNALFKTTTGFSEPDLQFLNNDGGRITLPFTGTYTVLVEGFIKEPNPVNFTLNVIPITDTTQALTLGSTVNGDLAAPGQQDTYTFNLSQSALLYFDSLTNNDNIQWSLTGPPGTVVSDRAFSAADVINVFIPRLPLPAGPYTLTVSATGQTAVPYSFILSNMADAPALTPGTPVSTTLNPANSTALYQFSATAGQSFYLASLSYSGGSDQDTWQLIDPYGNVLFSTSPQNDGGRLTLAATGDYTLLVIAANLDTNAPSFSFNVAPITDTTQALTLGSTVNGTLADPGRLDHYTFNLAANALLYFDAQNNNAGLQWTLSGPGGTAVSNRSFTASDGFSIASDPVLSLPAGPYTLTISGTGQTAVPYAFCLQDLSTATSLPPGTATNGTLNPANSTNLYQFSGNAGDEYTFVAQGGKGNQYWRLIDPYGNVVTGAQQLATLGPVTLLATGSYYLLVEGFISDTGTANYTITANFQGNTPPTPPGGTALTLGDTVTGNLTTATQQDLYNFTLSANALLYLDSLSAGSLTVWSLSGPGGTAVSNRPFADSDAGRISISPALALPAGVYSLTVQSIDGAVGGAYSFRLDNFASATSLTPGTAVSDTLNPGNNTNLYQFSGTAGQSYYFAIDSGSSTNIWWRLIDPYGNSLFSTQFVNDGGRVTLTASGTYTVLIEGDVFSTATQSFSFNAEPITDTAPSLTPGSLVNGTLATPGQQDSYTFNLSANAILYFDSLTNNAGIRWSLSGPPGTVVSNRLFTNSDGSNFGGNPTVTVPAGAYTLTVTGIGQTTGDYSFRLSSLATATPLTPGTPVSATLNPANSTDFYQFNATAGQSFYFASLAGSASARWRLIDPSGNMLFNNPLSSDGGRLTLTGSGAFTLLVEGGLTDTGTDSYSFNVAPITDTTQTLTLGSAVNATLAEPGEQDSYKFTLAAHTQLYFDSLTNSASIDWSLTGPTGSVVSNRHFDASDASSFSNNNVLPLPLGAYTLTVNAIGQTVGAYGFRFSDIATATPLTPGTPVSSMLNPANSTDLYQFSVTAGQPVYFAHLSGGTANTEWRLIDPSGNMLFNTRFATDGGRLTLEAGGTYTVLIEGDIADTGTVSYSFNVAPITDQTGALTLNNLVNASLESPGELDHYTFTLPANALVYFDALTNNSALEWSLSGPGGAAVNNLAFTSSDGQSTGSGNPVRALPAGSYTLTIFGTGQATGAYAFRLSNLTSAAPLTPGTPVTDTLNPADSTNLYRFQATAGQSFYFANLSTTSSGAIWRLIDPYGNSLFRLGLGGDAGRLMLGVTGTYTLLVEGFISDTGTVNYSFNVAPITDTTQALTLGGLVNGSLAEPGELDHYTFTLAGSALLYFDSLTNNSNFMWSLTGPDGTAVNNLSFTASDSGSTLNPVLTLPAGAYTLTVSGTGQTSGAYSFRLSDLSTATPLTPGTPVSGTLNPANSTNFYQFTTNAGDQYTFTRVSGAGAPNAVWRLVDPYGNVLFETRLGGNEGPLTVNATGTYTLLIEGSIVDTGTGTYSFNVQFDGNTPPVFSGTALTLNSTVNGNLTTAGQQDSYIFTLAANSQLYFDSLTNNFSIQWSLSGPSGTVVSNRSFAFSDAGRISNPALVLPAGNWTLTVSGGGQSTGAYSFSLDDMAAATMLTPGTAVSGSLMPANSTNLYQFQATAGEPFYFARISGSGGSGNDIWRLIDPYGKVVFSTFLSQDAGRIALTAAGTYTLLVEGDVGDAGSESYSFNVFPITDVSQPLTLGNLINGTLATPGEQDYYSLTLQANALLYFDSLTNNNSLQWTLSGPGGSVVSNRSFNGSDAAAVTNPVLALTAGNYALTIGAPGQVTGPYSFRLSDLTSAAPVSFNTQIIGTLNPGNSTNLYQFTANAGDSFYFASLKIPFALSGSSTADWRLVDPYGNILFSVNLGTDGGRFTLPATGTYTLLIEGGILNPIEMGYAFQIDQPQLNVVASDPNVPFVNQTGPITNISSPSFNVQFAGDGQAQGFDVEFVSPATGAVLASVPVSVDTQYLYQVRAVDPLGLPLTYSLTQAPSGMTIDPATGLITWVPTGAQVGQNSVTVQVEDTDGGTDTQSYTVTVTSESPGGIQGAVYNDENGNGIRDASGNIPPPPPGPFAPVGTAFPSIGVDQGPGFIITIGPDGALTTTNTGAPPYDGSDDTYVGVINDANSGVALGALELSSGVGIFGFDGDGIGGANFVPGGNPSNEGASGYEGPGTYFSDINQATTTGTVNFTDGLGDGLEPGLEAYFSLEGVPTSIQGTIVQQATPANLEPGLAGVTVYLDLNHTGQLEPSDPETQTDAQGHYFFSNLAPGAYTVAEVTGPGLQQTGPPNGTYTAVVQSGQVVSGLDFGNEVVTNPVLVAPKITSTAPATAAAGQSYRYAVSVYNPDNDILSFDLPVKPNGMVIDALTGTIGWEPTESQLGPQNVIVSLTDNQGDVVMQSFTVQVDEEAPPVITSTPPTQPAQTGLPYQYQVQAQDAQNDPITYSLLQPPAGMTIDPNSGLLSWVGPQIGPGLPAGYLVMIQADNGVGGQTRQTYTVFVITPGFDQPPVITSTPPQSIPPAPPGQPGTNLYYQVIATSPSGNPLTYSLPVAPTGMTISSTGLLHWVATLSDIGNHPVTIQVEDSVGLIVTQSFTINVTYNFSSVQGPAITSAPPELARSGLDYEYDATANDPNNLVVIWSLDTAPAGMSVNAMSGAVRWTPNLGQLGSANVVLRSTDTDGAFSTQSFTITVVSGDLPPSIVSTPPTQASVGQLYTYAVRANDVEGNSLTYSLVTAPAGMVIDPSTGLVQWAPSAAQLGSQQVVINVSDGQGGGAVQGFNIVVSSTAGSQPPVISSTPLLDTTVSQLYSYQVAATDPQGQTLSYSLINAPTGMSIDPGSGLVQWTPATTQLGSNPVLLAVTDTAGEIATQNFTIGVESPPQPPAITSTPVTTVTAGAPYTYDVIASDPDGDPLAYTLTAAPTGMTINSLGQITWSPQIADIDNQSVAVLVTDSRGPTVSQQYTIAVVADTDPPTVLLSLSASPVDLGTPDMAVVTATDNVGVTLLTLTINGTPVPLDTRGQATLPDTTAGTFTLVATASDAAGNVGTDTQTLVVINPQVTNAPTVAITTPTDGDTVTAPTQVIGTVQDPNLVSYMLSIAPMGSQNFTTFFTGTSQVTNGDLGTFDPTMLENDSYDLRLTATNTGGLSSVADITVNVAQKLKLGNFTLSFTDLTVPVSGIPITVTRTYDTLTADESEDFGFGWKLGFRNVDLRTSVGLTGDEADGFFNGFRVNSKVYVTVPGGQREGFTFTPKVADGLQGSFLGIFEPQFVPDPGVTDSLTVSPANLRIDADGNVSDFETGLVYNPADPNFGGSYLLTTKEGLAYSIDGITGQLAEVSDSNNNTLTFSDAGILSSTGTGIKFERDPQGRITAIVDPMGKKILYQYDAAGNLVAVTDRTNNTTQFVYLSSPAHYLNQVIDPLGRTGVRTDYDAQGRLTQVIDAAGHSVQLSFDPTHSVITTTDQLGNATTSEYDDRGNIVREIDPLGAVTLRTFDANNDLLTETDPLGRTTSYTYDNRGDMLTETDPLGNTTINTYQSFTVGTTALATHVTRLTTTTDALGDTTQASYNSFGNLVGQTDALGNTTTISNVAGQPAVVTDPLGNVTTNVYDAAGNRSQLIDADGQVTNFTYDADGNPLSQTEADGSGWNVSYTADGMPTNVSPIGLPHTVQYDAANEITQLTEPSGLTATLSYDALGHMTQVTLADGTIAQGTTYDAVGNIIAITDSVGNVTHYVYDADKHLIQTTYPDGSTETRTYDLAGELVKVTDALGNSTSYVYDADGQQIQTIDALGGVTSTQYDAAGRTVATTDPLGRTTRYEYDADGYKIATIAPDGSTTRNVYDADGRLVQSIDAAGNVTAYGYDPDGNLISVTDALGNVTSYQYNDDGGRSAIIDAKGNVTRFSYDMQGHVVQTTRADGETDTSTYNSAGELASTTNGAGQTIQYGYDTRGRLTSLTLPDGSQETYTYTGDNLISSVTDASGTTSYDYDPLTRRLVRVTEPDGRYIRYAYDAQGNRTLMADSMGAGQPEEVTQYAYDALNRLVQVTDPQGGVTNYTYDADGNLITTTLPNGVTETDTYDTLNSLVAIVDKNAGGQTIGGFSYTLDANGNRTKELDADGSASVYTYDALNRVIEEDHFDSSGQSTGTETYSYDALGNVTARSGTLLTDAVFSYNGDNQLVSGAGSTYLYDAAGRLLSVTDSTGQVTRYSYDARGRLVSSQAPDGTITSYTYDYQGVRQSQQGPDGLDKYLVDELFGAASAQVVRESDSTGATLRHFVVGARLLSFTEGANVGYYLSDGLGSTRLLTDQTGAVTDTYSYSAYGVLLGHTGSSDNPFLFAGQQQDRSSGLMYLRARYYDPATGRFLSPDAFSGTDQLPLSLNKYLYALADPVNDSDPSGNQDLIETMISEALSEDLDAIEAIGEGNQIVQISLKTLQVLGDVMTFYTALDAAEFPERIGGFFGGVLPPLARDAGLASIIPLTFIAVKMGIPNVSYYFDPFGTSQSKPEEVAYVRASQPNTVYLRPNYLTYRLFPRAESPLDITKVGVLIHEFAHLTGLLAGRLVIRDIAYGRISLALPIGLADFNADNYRLAAQANIYNLSVFQALARRG
jgi:RHS repeat-associated protein